MYSVCVELIANVWEIAGLIAMILHVCTIEMWQLMMMHIHECYLCVPRISICMN